MDSIILQMKTVHPDIEIKYSTMQTYFSEIRKANVAWPVYESDLLPTLTDMSEYWSGFYTTDPAFKRRAHEFTEITRSVASLASLNKFSSVKEHSKTIR
jgi:hypothetical protein